MQMDWNTIITALIALIVLPILKYGLDALKEYLEAQVTKINNAEISLALMDATNIVYNAVLYVMQTYVDSLKKSGQFDKEAQEKAFKMAKQRATDLINEQVKEMLDIEYGDFSTWLETQIETSVREYKKEG